MTLLLTEVCLFVYLSFELSEERKGHFACGSNLVLKKFGLSNPKKSNTCYANAIIQVLFEYLPLSTLSGLVLREKMILWRTLVDLSKEMRDATNQTVFTLRKDFIQSVGVGEYGGAARW
jgi:hypothetical protein